MASITSLLNYALKFPMNMFTSSPPHEAPKSKPIQSCPSPVYTPSINLSSDKSLASTTIVQSTSHQNLATIHHPSFNLVQPCPSPVSSPSLNDITPLLLHCFQSGHSDNPKKRTFDDVTTYSSDADEEEIDVDHDVDHDIDHDVDLRVDSDDDLEGNSDDDSSVGSGVGSDHTVGIDYRKDIEYYRNHAHNMGINEYRMWIDAYENMPLISPDGGFVDEVVLMLDRLESTMDFMGWNLSFVQEEPLKKRRCTCNALCRCRDVNEYVCSV